MPKIGNGLVLLIGVGNFIRLELLFVVYKSSFSKKSFMNIIIWVLLSLLVTFLDFSLTVKVAPHECVIRTGLS